MGRFDSFLKDIFYDMGIRARTPMSQRKSVLLIKKQQMNKAIQNLGKNINNKAYFGGVPTAKIGSPSVNGAVFSMKMNNGSRKVLKVVKSPLGRQEFMFQKNASNKNLAPRVYKLKTGVRLTPNYKMFFMNKVKTVNAFLMNNLARNSGNKVYSIHDFLSGGASKNSKLKAVTILKSKVKRLGNINIEHGNLHMNNAYVIIKADGTLDVMLIDFGRSRRRVGARTRAVTSGRYGHRYGKDISKNINWHEPLYEGKRNNAPVVLNANKMKALVKYSHSYAN